VSTHILNGFPRSNPRCRTGPLRQDFSSSSRRRPSLSIFLAFSAAVSVFLGESTLSLRLSGFHHRMHERKVALVKKLLRSSNDKVLALLRLVLGIVFYAHGSQKLLGWFGGHGWTGTMQMFTTYLHIPAFFAACAILAEFFGGIFLLAGFLSRFAALAIAIVMMVAILKVHFHNGLLGGPSGEGYEFPLALLALAILIVFKGGGAMSIDRAIAGDSEA
jgi:putative oxidoreductase